MSLIPPAVLTATDSPISPLLRAVDSLAKGVAIIGHNSVLQARKLAGVRNAIAALTEQRSIFGQRRFLLDTMHAPALQKL